MTLTGQNLVEALIAENLRLRKERDELRALLANTVTGTVARTIVSKIAGWVNTRQLHIHPRELARMIIKGHWR